MFGCCGAERLKFKNEHGQTEQVRLDKLATDLKAGFLLKRDRKS